MARYAVIRESDNQVVNVIEWDGVQQWTPPAGCFTVLDTEGEAQLTYTYEELTGEYIPIEV